MACTYPQQRMPSLVLRDMTFHAAIGKDSWDRPAKPEQPIRFSISVGAPITVDSKIDDLTIDYSLLSKIVLDIARKPSEPEQEGAGHGWSSPLAFHTAVADAIISRWSFARYTTMETTLPIGVCGAGADWTVESTITWPPGSASGSSKAASNADTVTRDPYHTARMKIDSIRAATIIGLKKHEFHLKQAVVTSLCFEVDVPAGRNILSKAHDMGAHNIVTQVVSTIEGTRFLTVEALIDQVRSVVQEHTALKDTAEWSSIVKKELRIPARMTSIRLVKTDALQHVGGAGVEMSFDWDAGPYG